LEQKYPDECRSNKHVSNMRTRLKLDLNFFEHELDELNDTKDHSLQQYQTIYIDLLEQQRNILSKINHRAEFNEELIRKYLALVDHEEFRMREKLTEETETE
jgi:hypothetical protein